MIYVDEPKTYNSKFKDYCHMWSDVSVLELVRFARKLFPGQDIKTLISWLQYSNGLSGEFWHFDVAPSYREKALKLGAQYMPLKDWVRRRMIERQITFG